jgi:hypothetical protein
MNVSNVQNNEASAEITIKIPRDKAWELLQDFSIAHNYVPGVIKTEITTELKQGTGASRKVYQTETKAIDETIEEWNEGYGFQIRLHRNTNGPPLPFKQAWFRYSIADDDINTRLNTSLIYRVRWGIIGRVLDRALLHRIIKGKIRDVAFAMKLYYETGERVTPEKLRQIKKECRNA